ncbi:MAG: efflux RND transporter periplasmic adaptor subunit [Nitrospira sp.]|nr:efflux RND transporter periplasmic adaptor subunit [Nitrospira sp.]
MNTLRGKQLGIFVIVLCLLYFGYRFSQGQHEAEALQAQTSEIATPTVALIQAKTSPSTDTITLPGNIEGWYEAPIYARVEGYVKVWHKDYGALVKKGDVLAEINTPDLDAEYRQALADLESERARNALAQLTAQRYLAMREHQALSEQAISVQLAEAKAETAKLAAAEQKMKNIEAFIGFKKILAPFDGVVIQRNINVGDLVSKEGSISSPNAKNNLFTVAVVDKLRLFVNVPANFGPFLDPGLTAEVTVPQLHNRTFKFDFLTVAKGFDVNTRTAVTVFTIDNKDRALWPGSYATVRLTAPVESGVVTIPTSAMVFQERGAQVAVLTEDDLVHFKDIAVAKMFDNYVEIKEGIAEGDRIVNNPSAALLEGDKVRIVTPAPGYEVLGQGVEPSTRMEAKQ